MKKFKNLLFIFIFLLIGGLFSSPIFFVKANESLKQEKTEQGVIRKSFATSQQSAQFSGEVINNIFYVNFKGSNSNWTQSVPSGYTKNIHTLMDNGCNNSLSSVNAYFDAMSFNTLNLKTNFHYKNNSTKQTFEIPFTQNEMLYYTASRPEGYYEYAVFSLGQSGIEYKFSCYDCKNDDHTENYNNHDISYNDGVGCVCAYNNYFQPSNPLSIMLEDFENTAREWIAIKSVLKQVSSLPGSIDKNNDGDIDAVGFVFPQTQGVKWNDLLWAHAWSCYSFNSYVSQFVSGFSIDIDMVAPAVRCKRSGNNLIAGFSSDQKQMLTTDIELNSKDFYDYNIYTIDTLLNLMYRLKDTNGMEQAESYTMTHELAHTLGLPDLYVYNKDYISQDDEGMHYMYLMCSNAGSFPSYLSTFNRKQLGFTNDNNIVDIQNEGNYTLKPINYDEINNNNNNSNNVLAYCISDSNYPNQKIYIEYRTESDNFASGLNYENPGLIIYRVDETFNGPGNRDGLPYNVSLLKKSDGTYIFNDLTNSFGNSNKTSTTNAITFQKYSGSSQSNITKASVQFKNTGIVINNISANSQTNEISFRISGGGLLPEPEVDLTKIKLKGISPVSIKVKTQTAYVDEGIDIEGAGYNRADFRIEESHNINLNVVQDYEYVYKITHNPTGQTRTIKRIVKVIDDEAPIIVLNGAINITLTNILLYNEADYGFNTTATVDNYNSYSQLTKTISNPILDQATGKYVVTYTVTDSSGNTTTAKRYITINATDFSSIKLNGNIVVESEAKVNYRDAGIDFGTRFNEADFNIEIKIDTVNINLLGTYQYVYKLTHKTTLESFELTRTVKIVDTTAPTISLKGSSYLELYPSQYNNYADEGYTVEDTYYGVEDINVEVSTVFDEINNQYVYTYIATDASGNVSEEITKIIQIIYQEFTQDQINLVFSTETEGKFVTETIIKIKAEVEILEDNNANPNIEFYINNQKIEFDAHNQQIVSNEFDYIFNEKGYYSIKTIVDGVEYTKALAVNDINAKTGLTENAIIMLIMAVLFMITIIIFIVLKQKAKAIKDKTERW